MPTERERGSPENAGAGTRPPTPVVVPRAAVDLGGADWERDLIAAIRRKGFLWRSEQTYRAWATRFAKPATFFQRAVTPWQVAATGGQRAVTGFSVRERA